MTLIQATGHLYSAYSNSSSPGSLIHEACSLAALKTHAALHDQRAQSLHASKTDIIIGRAKAYGCRAAMAPVGALKAIDLFVGTGLNSRGPVALPNKDAFVAHLGDAIACPTDTGVMGLSKALKFVPLGCFGALLGVAVGGLILLCRDIGNLFAATPQPVDAVKTVAACTLNGIVLGATATAALCTVPLALDILVVGTARLATAIVKASLAGAFFGVGYIVGASVGGCEASGRQNL